MSKVYSLQTNKKRFRLVVEHDKGSVYGLCTCSEAHPTEAEACECPQAKKAAQKFIGGDGQAKESA
jgi:hypothetical protein